MIAFVVSIALAASAADIESANASLAAGDPAAAEAGYRALLAEGYTGGNIYYNLGNVLWREKKVPGAILAWRRAAVRLPRDPDVQANLDFARRNVRDRLDSPDPAPWFAPWQVALTPAEARWLGCAVAGLGLLFVAARRRLPHQPLAGLGVALTIGGAFVATGGIVDAGLPPAGVILASETTATSDLGGGVSLFTLHAGAEVLVVEEEAGSRLIQLPDGRKGWVVSDHVGVAEPTEPFPML